MKNILSVLDYKDEVNDLIKNSIKLKKSKRKFSKKLKNKNIGLLFEKKSTRTRVSFESGINQLGGNTLFLDSSSLQLGRGESISDTAKVLSRYLDAIIYRSNSNQSMKKLSNSSNIPIINALDNKEHPCQILSDLLTIYEKKETFKNKLVYVGDGNNVCNSLLLGSSIVGMDMVVSTPKDFKPNQEIFKKAKEISKRNGSMIKYIKDPKKAVEKSDIIYTDVWISMGEKKSENKINKLKKYQVNKKLLKNAKKEVMIMHCLPAHRGFEITDDVLDSSNSVVFDQAENRLHSQKALLLSIFS